MKFNCEMEQIMLNHYRVIPCADRKCRLKEKIMQILEGES